MVLSKTMSMVVSSFAAVAGIALGPGAVRSADATAYLGVLPRARPGRWSRWAMGEVTTTAAATRSVPQPLRYRGLGHDNNVSEEDIDTQGERHGEEVSSGTR